MNKLFVFLYWHHRRKRKEKKMMGTIGLVMERGVERVWRYLRPHGLIKGSVVCFCCPAQPLKIFKKSKKQMKYFPVFIFFNSKRHKPKMLYTNRTEQNEDRNKMKDNIEEEEKATDGVWCHLFWGKMNLIRRGICFILFYSHFFFLDFQIYYFICFSVFLDGGRRKSFRNVRYD